MTRLRGIVSVFGMPRPRHAERERELVRAAFSHTPAGLTDRAKAAHLARRVVADLLKDKTDPFEVAVAMLGQLVSDDPAVYLARDRNINLGELLVTERVKRFAARGAQQLSPAAWRAETEEIARILERRLAERFRRKARESGR